jgi:hypothetical protein
VSDESEGLPLAEALRAYGDPELWAAYESARAKLRSMPRRPSWLRDSREARDEWSDRYEAAQPAARHAADRAWAELVADFRAQLVSGELLATGYEAPDSLDRQKRPIAAEWWTKSRINVDSSSARRREVRLRDILVRRAADPRLEAVAAEGLPKDTTAALSSKQKHPGPRTFMPEAEEEMLALASCGALTNNFKADSHVIAGRVAARFLGQKVCDPKTIRNRLNKLYRILYREQCAQINSGDF